MEIVRAGDKLTALAPQVVEQLRAIGKAWKEADGWHTVGSDELDQLVEAGRVGICDFCSTRDTPGDLTIFETEDFEIEPGHRSRAGWAACSDCKALILAGDRVALLERSILGTGHPDDSLLTAQALKSLHAKFWAARKNERVPDTRATYAGTVAALRDYIDLGTDRDSRIRQLAQRIGCPRPAVQALADMTIEELAEFVRNLDAKGVDVFKGDRALAHRSLKDAIDKLDREMANLELQLAADQLADGHRFVSPWHDPRKPWQDAIETQFQALKNSQLKIDQDLKLEKKHLRALVSYWVLEELFLRTGDSYAWGADPLAACFEASKTMLRDVTLTRDDTPGPAGWWYFPGPVPTIKTTTFAQDAGLAALLWGWFEDKGVSRLGVSAYCWSTADGLVPTQWFAWDAGDPVDRMLARAREQYRIGYETDGIFAKLHAGGDRVGEDQTIANIDQISLFLLAAFAWLRQTIIEAAPQPIERHRRKALVRDFKLKDPPTLRLVQLRRVERHRPEPTDGVDGEPTASRTYRWHWTVKGFWRRQHYRGGIVKPKYINPHLAGPRDLPLKPKTQTIYQVTR